MGARTPGFIQERLTEAREARGMTITGLADLVGLSKQSISAYEKGKQTPSPEVLDRISKQLNFPSYFFLKKMNEQDQSPIFFRSLSAATKRSRLKAERQIVWLADIVDYISNFVDMLPVNIPNFDIGKNPEKVPIDEFEELAMKCRQEWGLGNGPISNVVRLLENHGIIVTRLDIEAASLDAFSKWFLHNRLPIIVLGADKDSAVRSKLDAVHELAHLVSHRSLQKIGSCFKTIEEQAFRFASAFLMPADTFLNDFGFPNIETLLVLKDKWKVSIAAMIMRCKNLNIISESQATKLWIAYNHRGFRKREPLDDKIPIEQPVFIRRCIELLINEKIQSPEDISNALSLPQSDIEKLACLPHGYLGHHNATEIMPQLRHSHNSEQNPSSGKVIPFMRKKI